MAVTQYIGSRYVPLFADPIDWSAQNTYEPLTIVLHDGNSYTSKQAVPKGVDINNEAFWALTGNYNAQIELYRRDTTAAKATANSAQNAANNAQNDIDTLLPKADFNDQNTVKDYIDSSVNSLGVLLPSNAFNSTDTVKKYIDDSFDNVDNKLRKYVAKDSTSEMHYLFRLSAEGLEAPFNANIPQGMCMLQNNIGLFALAPSASSAQTTARLFKVNMTNRTVIETIDAQLGHCNSMCYDIKKNLVYVTPNQMAGASTSALLVCNPNTLEVQRSIPMPIQGRIMYDKITDRVFIANSSEIYEVNTSDYTTTKISDIQLNNISHSLVTSNGFLGNGMTVYNDVIYFTSGYDGQNLLVQINLNGEPVKVSQIPYDCYLYHIREFQDCDFTSDGILVIYSGGYIGSHIFGVVGGISINGLSRFPVTDIFTANNALVLNRTYDCNGMGEITNVPLTSLGSSGSPMLTPIEAQWASLNQVQTANHFIQLTGFIKTSELLENAPIYIRCISGIDSGLLVDKSLTLTELYIDAYSDSTGHAFIRKTLQSTGYLLSTYITMLRGVIIDFDSGITSAHLFNVRGLFVIGSGCSINDVDSSGALSQINQYAGLISCEPSVASAYPRLLAISGTAPTIVANLKQ